MMKIIIFGLGSIGQRHARILSTDYKCKLYTFHHKRRGVVSNTAVQHVYSWDEVRKIKPDIAFITNPTYLHIRTALKCAALGMHLFIEKPMSNTVAGIGTLRSLCRAKNLTCYTAYCLRFNPVIEGMKKMLRGKKIFHARITCSSYLPNWRKGRDVKTIYSNFKKKGGGALLELSHEFDYAQHLFGRIERITGKFGRLGSVTHDAEDFADIILMTTERIIINMYLSLFSRLDERTIVVDFEGGYIKGDLISGELKYAIAGKVQSRYFNVDRDKYLKKQTEYFLNNIGNPGIMNNIDESRLLLKKIAEFKNGRK
jgi:Predicted dehydrogenases and related proteins